MTAIHPIRKSVSEPVEVADLGFMNPQNVREGDIIFCSRPGFLLRLCSTAGELWRHVGIALLVDGPDGPTMGMVEVDGNRFVTRTLDQILASYVQLGVARLGSNVDVSGAVDWARYFAGSRNAYAWDDAVLAGFVALTRWHVGDADPDAAARLIRKASVSASARWADRRVTHTCSSFVYFAYNSGSDPDRLVVDLEVTQELATAVIQGADKVPELRNARGSRMDRQQLLEAARVVLGAVAGQDPLTMNPESAGRWVMPGDLWRSRSIRFRAQLPVTGPAAKDGQ